jgi:hypothetical protein
VVEDGLHRHAGLLGQVLQRDLVVPARHELVARGGEDARPGRLGGGGTRLHVVGPRRFHWDDAKPNWVAKSSAASFDRVAALRLSVLDQSPVAEGSTGAEALRNTLDLARLTDALGFHRYWVAEHHGGPSLAGPEPRGPHRADRRRDRRACASAAAA